MVQAGRKKGKQRGLPEQGEEAGQAAAGKECRAEEAEPLPAARGWGIRPQKERPKQRLGLQSRPRCTESPGTLSRRLGCGPEEAEQLLSAEGLVKAEIGYSAWV